MSSEAEVIILGSGPAGVSAAWPLVEAGVRVLMLDSSNSSLPSLPAHASRDEWWRDETRLHSELGTNGTLADGDFSPKLLTPLSRATLDGFAEAVRLEAQNYFAVGSLAAGGLSRIWGALATPYASGDLDAWGDAAPEMEFSYARVARRIGVSGEGELANERPTILAPPIERIVRANNSSGAGGFTLSRAMNAVLTSPHPERLACNSCGLCLYGCGRGSIYHSALELPALERFPNFTYRSNTYVTRLHGLEGAQIVDSRVNGEAHSFRSKIVILATGTLMTTSLALRRLGHTNKRVRLLNNPVGGAAFIVPSMVGKKLPDRSFGLGQLFYTAKPATEVEAAGVLYAADTLPLASVADRIPFTRPTALRLARALAPALVLATGYLPGQFSENYLTVADDESGTIRIEGNQNPKAAPLLRRTFKILAGELRRRGAWPVPGSVQMLKPGADAHPASTLPMRGTGAAATTVTGELKGTSGIYVVDGAALPVLSARHPTLTIMANADRIGRAIARRYGGA